MKRIVNGALALVLAFAALAAQGVPAQAQAVSVTIRRDSNDRLQVILENTDLRVRYAYVAGPPEQTPIVDFVLKSVNQDQAGNYLDGSGGRGVMTAAALKYSGPDKKTVRLEWNNGAIIQEVSLFPDGAFLQIDYLKHSVDVLDLGAPGQIRDGYYVFHGGADWRRAYVRHPESYYNRHPGEGSDPADGGSLNDNGYFVGAVYDPAGGRGYGRVMPVGAVDIIKLIGGYGLQHLPYYRQTKQPYTGYLFGFTGGPEQALALGGQLAARQPLPPFKLKTAASGAGRVVVNPDKPSYTAGEPVTLTALPDSGYIFSGWSGDLTGNDNPASFTMTSARTITATFTAAPPNQAPVLDPIGDRTVRLGATLAFTATASDADGDPLTFSITGLPAGAAFDGASGRFIWTPGAGDLGSRLATVRVSDGRATDQETFALTVLPEIPVTGEFKLYVPVISR